MSTAQDLPELASPPLKQRLGSIDAYRGLVRFLMMAEVLHFCKVSSAYPGNAIWSFLCYHQTHLEWVGCTLHDMIQPSFSLLVGVAMVGKADQLDEHDVAGNGTILRCGHRGAFAHGGQEHSVQVETTLTITSMSEYPVATKVSASSGTGGISTSTVWPQEWQVAWACACSLNPKAAP